jgi:hypothetical protein
LFVFKGKLSPTTKVNKIDRKVFFQKKFLFFSLDARKETQHVSPFISLSPTKIEIRWTAGDGSANMFSHKNGQDTIKS